jgi:hypothetical protein
MIKTVTRMMAATAALGLVAAPIIAHANTRAGDSNASYSTSNALPGLGRASGGEGQEEGGAGSVLLGVGAGTLIVIGGLVAFDVIGDDDDCASPGAC